MCLSENESSLCENGSSLSVNGSSLSVWVGMGVACVSSSNQSGCDFERVMKSSNLQMGVVRE